MKTKKPMNSFATTRAGATYDTEKDPITMRSDSFSWGRKGSGQELELGWPDTLYRRPVRTVLLIEPAPGALWAVEARLRQDWPIVDIHHAQNWVEGCLLIGRLEPDFISLTTEIEEVDVMSLMRHIRSHDSAFTPIVVLATSMLFPDYFFRNVTQLGVDAIIAIGGEPQDALIPLRDPVAGRRSSLPGPLRLRETPPSTPLPS